MKDTTHKFHAQLIRFAKGMIKAWEEWLEAEYTSR